MARISITSLYNIFSQVRGETNTQNDSATLFSKCDFENLNESVRDASYAEDFSNTNASSIAESVYGDAPIEYLNEFPLYCEDETERSNRITSQDEEMIRKNFEAGGQRRSRRVSNRKDSSHQELHGSKRKDNTTSLSHLQDKSVQKNQDAQNGDIQHFQTVAQSLSKADLYASDDEIPVAEAIELGRCSPDQIDWHVRNKRNRAKSPKQVSFSEFVEVYTFQKVPIS